MNKTIGKTVETIITEEIETPVGKLLAAATEHGLCLLEFVDVEDRLKRHVSQLEKNFKMSGIPIDNF